MRPLTTLRSTGVVLPDDDIDTDQIIPARWLSTTTREGLGAHCLASRRFNDNGTLLVDSPFTDRRAQEAEILIAGANFGCGSSREHAVWALLDMGIRAVIAPSFADIFASNAAKNGLLAAKIENTHWRSFIKQPYPTLTIDLEPCSISCSSTDASIPFDVDPFARHCLLRGLDPLGYLLDALPDIERHEQGVRQ